MTETPTWTWPEPPEGWAPELRQDFIANAGNGNVGTRLVSETERVRVWHLSLEPRERIGFHTHVLDYFWTAMTSGKARSRYGTARSGKSLTRPATPSITFMRRANS